MRHGELSIERIHASRKIIAVARAVIANCRADIERHYAAAANSLRDVEQLITSAPDSVPLAWQFLRTGLECLVAAGRHLAVARRGGDVVAERTRLDILYREFQAMIKASDALPVAVRGVDKDLCTTTECDARSIAAFLLSLPVPLLYWEKHRDVGFPLDDSGAEPELPSLLLRVIAFLDRAPFVTPQILKAGFLYTLTFRVRGTTWPPGATSLRLALVSTLPLDEYSVSEFNLPRPAVTSEGFEGEMTGNLKFLSPQSSLLNAIVFRLRAAFAHCDDVLNDVPIIGHHELRLRIVSPERFPIMGGNRHLDHHIYELVTRLVNTVPTIADELTDLLAMLESLSRLLAAYAQEAIYKGKSSVPEREFQATVLRDLRILLGQDVQEHVKQAGGNCDIRYRGVIVELKVETEIGDRETLGRKFAAQTTQYAGVEARQVAVLLVLDLTSKDRPPGDIRNDVLLVDVPTHGEAEVGRPYPSKVFVFVVNGNLKSPSDYS